MDLVALLENFREVDWNVILVIVHVIGAAFGAGGAFVSDLLFFRSLKDGKISEDEFGALETASKAVWIGLGILILSGLAMFALIYSERGTIPMLSSPRWQAKLTLVAIVTLNGIFFKVAVFPRLRGLVGKALSRENVRSSLWHFAVSGFISIFSWYSIIIISLLPRTFRPPYALLMGVYAAAVVMGIVMARAILKRKLAARAFPSIP